MHCLRFVRSRCTWRVVLVLLVALAASACNSRSSRLSVPTSSPAAGTAQAALPTVTDQVPLDYPGLHNVVAYAPDVLSGSAPEGDAGFQTLQSMGIRTILTVDGAEPELETARRFNLRYVHLPISYSGFDEQRKLELAKAIRDLSRPIYVHCHHGKHRSAGAAGAAVVTLGWMSTTEAIKRMKVSGTAPDYKGLYACTANAAAVMPALLDALEVDFRAAVRPQGTRKTMVEIDITTENLKAIQKAGWKTPTNHPDLVPAAEAGRLADYYRFLHATSDAATRPSDYQDLIAEANRDASELEDRLLMPDPSPAELDRRFSEMLKSCKTCHAAYRD